MSTDDYPVLWHFLGAYLNQDWPEEHTEPFAALDDFISGETELAPRLPDEIDRLLSDAKDRVALEQLLVDLGSGYVPSRHGLDPREWLALVHARTTALGDA